MKTQHTTIGMVAKRFASVVCILSAVLALAPAAWGDEIDYTNVPYVSTDCEWETMYNPFAEPSTMAHWMSAMVHHTCWTNYEGGTIAFKGGGSLRHEGYRPFWRCSGTWLIGTNHFDVVNMPDGNMMTAPLLYNNVEDKYFKQYSAVPEDETCLARIQQAAEAKLDGAGVDDAVGANLTIALCKLLRPHEARGPNHNGPHSYVASNLLRYVDSPYRVESRAFCSGVRLDALSFTRKDQKIIDFTFTPMAKYAMNDPNAAPSALLKAFNDQYGPGIKNCIATLDLVPDDWEGTYLLHNRDYKKQIVHEDNVRFYEHGSTTPIMTNRTRTVTHPEAWPALDEDVYLDRGDVLVMKSLCHMVDSAVQMLRAYDLPGQKSGKWADPVCANIKAVQEHVHEIGYTYHTTGQTNHLYRVGSSDRIERAIYELYHEIPEFLTNIVNNAALEDARAAYEKSLACLLDADAFINGKATSATGKTITGKRNLEQLHLIEFAESDEEGGEWNFAGWREFAEKTYFSLTGKGTDAAVQTLDLADIGKKLDIHVGSKGNATDEQHGVVDFSGLGPDKDGKITFDANAFFDGQITRNGTILDPSAITTNGPAHWVKSRYSTDRAGWWGGATRQGYDKWVYGERVKYLQDPAGYLALYPTTKWGLITNEINKVKSPDLHAHSNLVQRLHLNLSPATVDSTLNGLYPSGTLFDDLTTMKAQFPASGESLRSGFAQMVDVPTCKRTELKEGEKVTIADGVYTAPATTENGGAFCLKGANSMLSATNVTFSGNSAAQGGAICLDNPNSFVAMYGTFALETPGDDIYNNGSLEWCFGDGYAACLKGYENLKNDNGLLYILFDSPVVASTNYVIATGDFSDTTGKNEFWCIVGGDYTAVKIDGGVAVLADGWTGYKLETVEDLSVPTTNLVLSVIKYTCVRTELKAGESTNLVAGTTYTAAPTTFDGGAFYVREGTLTGTDVTFEGNNAYSGCAIYNYGVVELTQATFRDNVAQGPGGAIDNSGVLNLNEVAFENNTAGTFGGAIFNEAAGTANLQGTVLLTTTNDTILNLGLMNWDLTGEPTGVLNGYENLVNEFSGYTGTLQVTIDDEITAPTNIVIATGNFSNIEAMGTDTFVITNSVKGGATTTAKIDGGRVVAGGSIYQLATEEDLGATPPTTNLVFTVIQPDMSKVIVNSNLAGKYKPGDEVEIEGETYYYGINCFDEIPHDGSLANTETLEIAGGSASITNEVTLKAPAKLVIDNGAALSIMGEGSITNSLAATDSISGNGAIYLDKGLTDDQLKNYTDKLADGSAVTIARASVDDKTVKETAKVEEGGKTYYNVITSDQPRSEETDNTVVTSAIVVDGAGDSDGLLLKTNDEKPLIVAGSVTTTAPDQSLKLVKEQAADLTVNGKVSGFETIVVENKNEAGKMVTTSTLAANNDITINNQGHLEAKAISGGQLVITNTSANTIIGEYSGMTVFVTNTAEGVAQDITLQAYGNGMWLPGMIYLLGENGSIYSNATIVAGMNATPADLSANDGTGLIYVYGTNTFSGAVLVKADTIGNMLSPRLRFENADATISSKEIPTDAEISGACNIASNDNGAVLFTGAVTLKDGAVLGGKTRLASTCDSEKFVLEGTVTLKDGAEVSRVDNLIEVPSDATLKLQGSKIRVLQGLAIYGTLDVEDGLNDVNKIGSMGTINLKGGELIIDEYLSNASGGGVLNWDLTAGTTTLDWSKVSGSGALMMTVPNAVPGTSYMILTNDANYRLPGNSFTVTNSVAGGAAVSVKPCCVTKVGGQFWYLDYSFETKNMQITALDSVKLTDVAIIDPDTGATNATGYATSNNYKMYPDENGVIEVPKGMEIKVVYTAADDLMFGPGWQKKTVNLGSLTEDTSMTETGLMPETEERWADSREIALDTRERIVVEDPSEVLPVAYSPTNWGAVAGCNKANIGTYYDDDYDYCIDSNVYTTEGYYDWQLDQGFGKYTVIQSFMNGWDVKSALTNYVYYSTYFPLSWATPVGGTLTVTNGGVSVASGDQVLGYSLLNLAATPTYNGHERYEFTGWTAKTNGVEWTEAFKDPMALTQTLEMPNAATELAGGFQWKSNYTENISVAGPVVWEVREGEDYSEGTVSVMNGGTFSSKYAVSVTALTVAAGSTNVWDFTENGQPSFRVAQFYNSGTLEILFDSTLTNGVYTLLTVYPPTGFSGVTSFRITDGTTTKDCSVSGGYAYVGAKRFKIALSTTGMGAAAFILTVESGLPMALTYAQPDGGTITAYTNGAEVASGTKVLPSMAVEVVATTNLYWQFNGWSGTDATGVDVPFAEPLSATTTFKMPETNATVTANFIVSEAYKAELQKACDDKYAATTNAIEALRLNRLTDDETDKALSVVKGDYDTATRDISNAPTPKAAEDAKNFADATLSALAKNVGEFSDAKPYDLIVADDFEAIADEGSYDPETGAFTVNSVAYTNGVNAFTSFRAAYGAADTAFTTNVHVYGTQLIEDDVTNLYPWTLDLHDAVLSIGIDENKNLYASITNALNAITGGEGIVFGKTEDAETRAVKAVLDDVAKASGADITVKAADVTPTKTGEGEDEVIEAKVDEKAKTTDGVTTLPQMVSDEGSINITVESTVTNDTVVAGKVAAPEGTVTIVHYPTNQALTVAGEVTAKNVVIDNYGHFEADVTAVENITIMNRSMNTIVGTYEGKSITLTGDNAAISNVTFAADSILLYGYNVLTGPLTLDASSVTNFMFVYWSVQNGNKTAHLNNLDAIVDRYGKLGSEYVVVCDRDQTMDEYVLADNAASAANRKLSIKLMDGGKRFNHIEDIKLGETWYPGDSRGYTLTVNAANQLVLTVGWGGVRFAESAKTGSFGEPIDVEVDGGMPDRPTQVTVSLQKNTLTSYKAYDKATGKKVSFPLTLNWDAGTRETKVITVVPTKGCGCSADDVRFLTLQLGSEVGQLLVAPQVCTVTVGDPEADDELYVRALPWPANGGRVSGYGAIKTDKYGAVKTTRTLKAKANKWATFAGWYAAKADNPNEIDLENKITDATTLKVGKGTDYIDGTFYAYFTDVLAVPAVNLPDATAAGATGVTGDGVRTYTGMAGVKFSLPISSDDDEATISVSGLPSGLKYSKATGCIEGVPTKACAKTVKVIAKNAAGKHTATFDFVIDELPYNAIGTWNGVVRELEDPDDGTHAGFGTVQFSATSAGKLSAKVMTRLTGTKSFSVKGYDLVDENTLGIAMETSKGEVFKAALSLTNDWKTAQLAGTVEGGNFAANGEEVKFTAIRSTCFDKKDKNQEALDFLAEYKGEYEDTLTVTNGDFVGSVTFKVKDGGKVQVKAKSVNGTYSATCAGAFRATPKDFGAVQTAVRSSKRLWACDALLDAETGDAAGLACDYDADGADTHEVIGTSVPWASGSPSEMRIRGAVAK